jgi:2,4-diketo-3-deoxy-L-fuconate hydrolase
MRICRFDNDRIGLVDGDEVVDVTSVVDHLPAARYPLPRYDPLIGALDTLRPLMALEAKTGIRRAVADVKLLSPVANANKIIAAPVNYRKHLAEAVADSGINHAKPMETIHTMGVFLKAGSSVVGADEGIKIRHPDRRNDHEVELCAIIGTQADRVPAERALDYVAGYCIGLDMTLRGGEERSLRKSIDSYTVLGPWMVTADELGEPGALDLSLSVSGEMRQSANTRDLILNLPELIALASSFYTLMPGDVIMTGTPEGVGPVQDGDILDAAIERIGRMRVLVGLDPGAST